MRTDPSATRPRSSTIAVVALLILASVASAHADGSHFVIVAPVADLYRSPSRDAEVISQAIFSSDVIVLEESSQWLKIRTADEYTGWIPRTDARKQESAKPYASENNATVASMFARIYREADVEKHHPVITIPFESRVEVTGEKETPDGRWYSLRMPDGTTAWIQSGDVSFDDKPLSIPQTISLAKLFLGLPYTWGGTSSYGFDCSGFTQMLMRKRGVIMPRDTGPQSRWDGLVTIERSELQPGDLIFFGSKPPKVNHTGMYIGNGEFIHSTRRDRPMVQISRLDDAPWTNYFISARRLK